MAFSPDGHQMATCGNDDHVRIWHFPWLNPTAEIIVPGATPGATSKEDKIEDAQFDAIDGNVLAIVTPSAVHVRDYAAARWVAKLEPLPGYAFRCARFTAPPGRKRASYLITVENSKGKNYPILCLWRTDRWSRYSKTKMYTRLRVTTMGVSSNGRLVAIGSADGSVSVYDWRLYVRHCNNSFASLHLIPPLPL